MPKVYDDWERLVRATLRREQLRLIAQRTLSDLSLASSSSSSFNFAASSRRLISPIKLPIPSIGDAFDYDHILRASNYFADSNLIAHGHSGDLFFGVLDSEVSVVVKRIDFSSATMEADCLRELEFHGRASHSRFVPLLGHCSDNLNNQLFLVYKYMPNLDLASSLFREPEPDDDNDRFLRSLDWITRLKIAIGVAEALSYLHHECSTPLVHRDIQASTILLDDKYEVRLGSLSNVCAQEPEKHNQNQNRFTRFLRPRPPAVKSTPGLPNATCPYDVYCFGKVLLELVTGKLGISKASGDNAAMKQDSLEQLLPYITIYDQEPIVKIVDPSFVMYEDLLEEVWSMAIVARACLNPIPSKRPLMKNVLKALESPLEVVREDYLGDIRIEETSPSGPREAIVLRSWWDSPSDLAAKPVAVPPPSDSAVKKSGAPSDLSAKPAVPAVRHGNTVPTFAR